MTRIRLKTKLAAILDGIDVSSLRVGDILELPSCSLRSRPGLRRADVAFDFGNRCSRKVGRGASGWHCRWPIRVARQF
jgi:hypothetical protein